jgi:PAS domain S-box-containing protein
MWETDAETRFTWLSQDIEDSTGLPNSYYLERKIKDLIIPEEDPESWAEFLAAIDAHQPVHEFSFWRTTREGNRRCVAVSAKPLSDSDNVFLGYRGVTRDITERRLAETAMQTSESRFRDLTESITDWLWEMGPDFRYSYVSPQVTEFIGVPAEYYLGKTREELGPPNNNIDEWKQLLEDQKAHRPFRDFRHERIGPNGNLIQVSLSGKPIFDDRGEFLGYRGTAQDISAKIETERRANRNEERFNYAIKNSKEAFSLFDGNERLVVWNEIFGNNSLVGQDYFESHPTFEDILKIMADNGLVVGVDDSNKTEWIEDRLATFRAKESPLEYQTAAGDWRQVWYDGLPDGSTIARYLDITDQKRQEVDLRESEERYALAIAGTNDGIWDWDIRTHRTYRSPRWYEIIGYDADEIEPQTEPSMVSFLEYVLPEDRDKVREALLAHIHERAPYDIEYRLLHKSGDSLWVRGKAQAVWGENNEPLHMAGSISDISDLKREEEKRRLSEKRYELAIAGTNDGIWERNFMTGEVHRSARFYEIIGYDPDNLAPNTEAFYGLLKQEDADRCLKAFTTHLETHEPFDIGLEYQIRCKSGEYIWIEISAQAEWDDDGVPIRMVGSISDISKRKQAESNLLLTQYTLDHGGDAAFWLGENGGFEYINQATMKMLGYSEEEFSELHIWDVDPAVRQTEWPDIWARLTGGDEITFEAVLIARDGGEVPVEATDTQISFGDRLIVCCIMRDTSERKQAEEQIRQAQKMEAVGLLTGGIAHEFNNLLMVVVGNIEMLQNGVAADVHLERFAATALKGAMRGAELTQSLLSFSRKQTLAITSVDINGIVSDMSDTLRHSLWETINWEVDLARDLPNAIADISQYQGALLNLVLNARDAMPDGGKIIVRTSKLTIDLAAAAKVGARAGDYVSLEVIDTGHGMTAETIDQAFEPFFTTKDVGEGTGLGLSMVYGLARQLDGFVEIDSKVGFGTKVRICLPRDSEDNKAGHKSASAPKSTKSIRAVVLLVEDDPDVRQTVARTISDLGCTIIEAENGKTALARLKEHPEIDVLFSDVMLPGNMSGPDIVDEARRLIPGLKVILTSGYPDHEINELVPDHKRRWFIRKPYRRSELAELLEKVLET